MAFSPYSHPFIKPYKYSIRIKLFSSDGGSLDAYDQADNVWLLKVVMEDFYFK